MLIPLLSRPVIAVARPLLRKLFGVSGKLAAQNAVRNPRRTGATASALAIGLTLVTGISVLGVTLGQAIDKMTTDNIRADYMVSMASGDSLDESALTALRKADGVAAASPSGPSGSPSAARTARASRPPASPRATSRRSSTSRRSPGRCPR